MYPVFAKPTYSVAPWGTETLSEDVIASLTGFDVSWEMFAFPTGAYAVIPKLVPWKPLF
jgi:hypothetical protein